MSFLSTVGKDIKSVFGWLASSKGQAVVTGAENLVEVGATVAGIGAPVAAGIALLNNWMGEAIKLQALGEAAGATTGSSTVKAAAVISTMTPELMSWLTANGYATTNVTAQATTINNAAVALLNALGAPATTPVPTTATA